MVIFFFKVTIKYFLPYLISRGFVDNVTNKKYSLLMYKNLNMLMLSKSIDYIYFTVIYVSK